MHPAAPVGCVYSRDIDRAAHARMHRGGPLRFMIAMLVKFHLVKYTYSGPRVVFACYCVLLSLPIWGDEL